MFIIFYVCFITGRDSKIYVFRLSEFEPDTQKETKSKLDLKDHKLERTRGCSMYAISKPGGSRLKMVKTILYTCTKSHHALFGVNDAAVKKCK